MKSIAARLEALERTAPLSPDIEALIQQVAADEGYPAEELRDTVVADLRKYRGMTPRAIAEATAAEAGYSPEEILEEAEALAAKAGQL